jgi:hypothetical protein
VTAKGPRPDYSGLAGYGSARESASDAVLGVMAWYAEQIILEQQHPEPNPARIDELTSERRTAQTDLERAKLADLQEALRIADAYAARLRDLTA